MSKMQVYGASLLLALHRQVFPGSFAFPLAPAATTNHHTTVLAGAPNKPVPIDGSGWPDRFPAKEHCSRCGLCETTFVSHVTEACAFLGDRMGRIDEAEIQVHGRGRDLSSMIWSDGASSASKANDDLAGAAEEARFGVMHEPMRLVRGRTIPDAQWTGVVTGIALSMLESGMVDAVVCISNKHDNARKEDGLWAQPEPIIARTPTEVLRGRGVKPALAPSLKVLDEIDQDSSIRKLLFCGVGCAVQAFRAVQATLDLDEIFVLGTNCVDNSPTPEAAENFIREGLQVPNDNSVQGYEFMQDFRVHVKTSEGYKTKPYFSLPGTIAESAIATSCRACFDYTNALADVVVGYMAAPLDPKNYRMDESFQTLTIRNERGAQMVKSAQAANRLEMGAIASGRGSHELLATSTVAADSIVLAMVGGDVPEKGMPQWMGEIMAFALANIGPKGVAFARYSIDYHIARNFLHVLKESGHERAYQSMPKFAVDIVEIYLKQDAFSALASKVSERHKQT